MPERAVAGDRRAWIGRQPGVGQADLAVEHRFRRKLEPGSGWEHEWELGRQFSEPHKSRSPTLVAGRPGECAADRNGEIVESDRLLQ